MFINPRLFLPDKEISQTRYRNGCDVGGRRLALRSAFARHESCDDSGGENVIEDNGIERGRFGN